MYGIWQRKGLAKIAAVNSDCDGRIHLTVLISKNLCVGLEERNENACASEYPKRNFYEIWGVFFKMYI